MIVCCSEVAYAQSRDQRASSTTGPHDLTDGHHSNHQQMRCPLSPAQKIHSLGLIVFMPTYPALCPGRLCQKQPAALLEVRASSRSSRHVNNYCRGRWEGCTGDLPIGARRLLKAAVTSAANAFIGATYTTLNSCFCTTPCRMCCPISRSTEIIAMLVLPAPVGAHTSRFWLLVKAVWKIRLCMRLSDLQQELA